MAGATTAPGGPDASLPRAPVTPAFGRVVHRRGTLRGRGRCRARGGPQQAPGLPADGRGASPPLAEPFCIVYVVKYVNSPCFLPSLQAHGVGDEGRCPPTPRENGGKRRVPPSYPLAG